MLNANVAIFFVQVDDAFGVGIRAEAMYLFQALAQLLVVVAFAVIDNGDGLIFVEDGLVAAGHIDDRQAAHGQRDPAFFVISLTVRTAMLDSAVHAAQNSSIRLLPGAIDDAANATHQGRSAILRISCR